MCGGVQYFKIEEVDRAYDFLVGLNSKFDIVQGRILGHRPIPSLMEVCSQPGAINSTTVSATNSIAFSGKLSDSDSYKQNEKQAPVCEHCKRWWHTKEQC